MGRNNSNYLFTDVKKDAWYTHNIVALYGTGIINNYEDNTFKPNAPITRAEFSKMIVEAFNLSTENNVSLPFTDLKANAWYLPTIETLYSHGLINGVTETLFVPGNMIKRGDATWLVYNVTLLEDDNTNNIPNSFLDALDTAYEYLAFIPLSKTGLFEQLVFDGYTEAEATYAIDHVDTDWDENALRSAHDYLMFGAFSKQDLFEQLVFDGYTEDEASYAVDHVDADWNE